MRRRERTYKVAIGSHQVLVRAKTDGCAFRRAVRSLIRRRKIKRQPPTSEDGGWKGTSIGVFV